MNVHWANKSTLFWVFSVKTAYLFYLFKYCNLLIPGLFSQRTMYVAKKATISTSVDMLQQLDGESTFFHVCSPPIFVCVFNSKCFISNNKIVTSCHLENLRFAKKRKDTKRLQNAACTGYRINAACRMKIWRSKPIFPLFANCSTIKGDGRLFWKMTRTQTVAKTLNLVFYHWFYSN